MSEDKSDALAIGLGIIAILFGITGTVLGAIAYDKSVHACNNETIRIMATFTPRLFIYRPGFTGTETQGLFSDWNALYAAMSVVSGPKQLGFDATDGAITIPSSSNPWDMTSVEWITSILLTGTTSSRTTITIASGATFRNLANITGSLLIVYQDENRSAMVYPSADNGAHTSLTLRYGAALSCEHQPFVQVNSGQFTLMLQHFSELISNPVIETTTSGVTWILAEDTSTIATNVFSGAGQINVIKQSLTTSISTTQPNVTGTLSVLDNVSATTMNYVPAVLANWSGVAPSSVSDALDRIAATIGPVP